MSDNQPDSRSDGVLSSDEEAAASQVRPPGRPYHAGPSLRDARGRSISPVDPVKARLSGYSFGDSQELHAAIMREVGFGFSKGMNWAVAAFLCTFGIVAIVYLFAMFTSPFA